MSLFPTFSLVWLETVNMPKFFDFDEAKKSHLDSNSTKMYPAVSAFMHLEGAVGFFSKNNRL